MGEMRAVRVLYTVDTEVWCDGWQNIDTKFPETFQRYVYGRTQSGDYGLPFQLKVLNDNGLDAVFFVEPFFALRFGLAPLEEIVGLITAAGQSVEMHLHTEWVDESLEPLLPNIDRKRQHIHDFSYDDQLALLRKAQELLQNAGASPPCAYRAGSFGANNDTLKALAAIGIRIDSSFNTAAPACCIKTSKPMNQPAELEGVIEVPVTVFRDGLRRQRPAQLTACSFGEMKSALLDAFRRQWEYFVILSHPFELLNDSRTRVNSVVVKRYIKLCEYLGANRDRFPTINFASHEIKVVEFPFDDLSSPLMSTLYRQIEQLRSRFQ